MNDAANTEVNRERWDKQMTHTLTHTYTHLHTLTYQDRKKLSSHSKRDRARRPLLFRSAQVRAYDDRA